MSKVKLTPPVCPACEASMDQVSGSNSSVWLCSQRPGCRGRRCTRRHAAPARMAAKESGAAAE
jgi:hypothetical protein